MIRNRPASKSTLVAVGIFTALYLCAAIASAFARGNTEFVFYIGVMFVMIGAIVLVHRRVGLSGGLLWALSIWGALHMAGGLVPVPNSWPINGDIRVLYSWWIIPNGTSGGWLKYDQIVHAFGFAVTTTLCWQALRGAFPDVAVKPTLGLMILVAAAGMGFGALNEVIEFIATRIAETNVGGYVNTGWDLVSNLTGCVLAACLIRARGVSA